MKGKAGAWLWALGIAMWIVGMATHASDSSQVVFGRWSTPYAAALAAAVAFGFLSTLLMSRPGRRWAALEAPVAGLLGIAMLLWGGSYLMTTVAEPSDATRFFALDLFGSIHPIGVYLDWLALTLVFITAGIVVWRRSRRGSELLLTVSAVVVTLLLLELAFRVKAHAFPGTQGFPTASAAIWERRNVRLDEDGFRNDRSSPDEGGPRLLIVGDSYAFGEGIPDLNDRFGEILTSALSEADGRPWTSRNVSRGDTHTRDHIQFLGRIEAPPDLVVLEYVFNDMDYLVAVTPRSPLTDAPSGLLDLIHPGRLALLNSYLFQELFARVRHLFAEGPASSPYRDPKLLEEHLNDLETFTELSRSTGAVPVIIPFDVALVESEAYVQRYDEFIGALRSAGLPHCSLRGAFEGHTFSDLTVNRLDVHPSPLANLLAANFVLPCVRGFADSAGT